MPELINGEWICKYPRVNIYRARKDYICADCSCLIHKGEKYARHYFYTGAYNNQLTSETLCMECGDKK